jgi:phosphoglycerate dehydrogenase-like enzyme
MVERVKILLPDTIDLQLNVAPDDEVVGYSTRAPLPDGSHDADVIVLWANGRRSLAEAAERLTSLRLVQGLMAGPDAVLEAGFDPAVPIASGRGLHDGPVAEHALALILAAARGLDVAVEARHERRWATELVGAQSTPDEPRFVSLDGSHVVIWGFGSIARRLAPLLTALGARVTGVASTAGERDEFPVVTDADLPDLLPTADLLVSLLPALPETRLALSADLVARLPRHAWFVNVGRGATVCEPQLQAALRAGELAGAALDVFETEPLAPESAWWDTPNVILTPHSAGGRPQHAEELIEANLEALRTGAPLRNVVAR